MTLANSPGVSSTATSGLTTFIEASEDIKVDDCKSVPSRQLTTPYAFPSLGDIPERKFLIFSFNWTPTTTIQKIPLIGNLAVQTGVQALFKLYRLFRACFEIDIKMVSSQYHQGALMVGWLPCINASTVPLDIQSLSAYHATILGAAAQTSNTIKIPYLSPEDWQDTTTATGTSAETATVFILPLFTLLTTNAGIPASIPIEVYGSIKEMSLAGFQSQMRTADGSIVPPSANKTAKSDAEAKAKATQGKDASVGMVVRNISHIARTIPIIGGVWSPIADVINAIFSTELSKPLDKQANRMVLNQYFNDTNQATGLDNATSLSLYQNPGISNSPVNYGMDTSYKSLAAFAGKPMLFDVYVFNGITVSWQTAVQPLTVGSGFDGADYLAIAATNFKYWRGSIKYLIYVNLPCFYAFRMRIRIAYNTTVSNIGNVPSMNIDVKGDTTIKITVPYLNYALWNEQYTGVQQVVPTLIVEQISPIIGPPAPLTSLAYMAVFRSGGEDTQFAVLCDPALNTSFQFSKLLNVQETEELAHQSTASFSNQMNLQTEFSTVFPPIVKGATQSVTLHQVMAETVDDVNDIFKRATEYINQTTVGQIGFNPIALCSHQIFADSFMWWRGGRIIRNIRKGNTSGNGDGYYLRVGLTSQQRTEFGYGYLTSTATSPMYQEAVSLPWYCSRPYIANSGGATYILLSAQRTQPTGCVVSTSTQATTCLTAGDDFCMMFQVPWANQSDVAGLVRKAKTKQRKAAPTANAKS